MVDCNVDVVVPAAGKGERCFDYQQKQYYFIMGKPLFLHSVEAFLKISYVRKICIVSDNVEYAKELIDYHLKESGKIFVVSGGHSRHESIKNGLSALAVYGNPHVVIIHDGARPIVDETIVKKVVETAKSFGAAGTARPLTSTVVKPSPLNNGDSVATLDSVLDRSLYLASEMPQAFLFNIIYEAYKKCDEEDLKRGTECLQLVLKYCGVRGKLIPGSEGSWKVTEKKDCYAAEAVLKAIATRVCIISFQKLDIVSMIAKKLRSRFNDVATLASEEDKPPVGLYNTVICLHNRQISQIIQLADLLDVDNHGLIIHVVFEEHSEGTIHINDLLLARRTMMKQYEKLKKGVVIIRVVSKGEEERLTDLIRTLVLDNSSGFSGQSLFL